MNVFATGVLRNFPLLLAAAAGIAAAAPAVAGAAASVMMYHRFGESGHPSTNVAIDQFEAHLKEIREGGYTVMKLPTLLERLRGGGEVPDRTIAITVDDAFLSVYREAWPRLRRAGIPFTLFVATEAIDGRKPGYMNWDQIRELRDGGVTIGSQTATHPHMPLLSDDRNRAELAASNRRFVAELGAAPTIIAYPYGEYSLAVGRIAREAGFTAGFGQHSGVVHPDTDPLYLPRFAFNENFGDLQRFRLAARALPVPVRDLTPADPFLAKGAPNPPALGFTVDGPAVERLSRMRCYASSEGKVTVEQLGERRIEVRMTRPFPTGRSRVNCTLAGGNGRWYWFGRQFVVAPGR